MLRNHILGTVLLSAWIAAIQPVIAGEIDSSYRFETAFKKARK